MMSENKSLIELLKSFKKLLLKEKKALIQNKGDQIQEIVKQKEFFLETINQTDWNENERESVQQLAQEVRELQETNLLLTEQSMSYIDTFLSAFQKAAQKQSVTYSKKGSYQQAKNTGLLDQSL